MDVFVPTVLRVRFVHMSAAFGVNFTVRLLTTTAVVIADLSPDIQTTSNAPPTA